jgi:hypothetical protein
MTSKFELQSKYYNTPGRAPPPPPPQQPTWAPPYDDPMQQVRNAETINMSAELFEKLYLARGQQSPPQIVASHADWRMSLGNPTPM